MTQSAIKPIRIHSVDGFQARLLGILGRMVHHWQCTLSYQGLQPLQDFYLEGSQGSIILLWHNRLFPVIGSFSQVDTGGRRLYALVSASRDGAQLTHFLQAQGISTVRGSSSRRGASAARELVRIIRDGHHVAITVDGPRGPCYQAQSGASLLVQLTGAQLCLIGAEFDACTVLDTWDQFIVPRPFSRVKMKLDRFMLEDCGLTGSDRSGIQQVIQDRLRNLTGDRHREA